MKRIFLTPLQWIRRKAIISAVSLALATVNVVLASEIAIGAPDFPDSHILSETSELPQESPSQRLTEEALTAFNKYKEAQFSGEEEHILFPLAYEAARLALEAVGAEGADAALTARCGAMLMDLDPVMAKGAIYWSGNGNSPEMARYARLYVDIQLCPALAGYSWQKDPRMHPSLVYVAASTAYNAQELEPAKRYFEEYLSTGEEKQRQAVMLFFGQTCLATNEPARAFSTVTEGVRLYPSDRQMINLAIQLSLDSGETDRLPELLERALLLSPNDSKLLEVKAAYHERNLEFKKALEIYLPLAEANPTSLRLVEKVAQCYYNLGVGYYNESVMAEEEKEAKRARRQSKAYFETAMPRLEEVLANLPNSEKYLKALGVTYGLLELNDKFEEVNNRLRAMGKSAVAANQMPAMMGADEGSPIPGSASKKSNGDVPSYEAFAKAFIEPRLAKYAEKGEFETVDEYQKRISGGEMVSESERLSRLAAEEYIKKYSGKLRLSDLKLSPYDSENETFMISSNYGPIVVKVPMKNHEAEMFKAGWDAIQLRNPKFRIADDRVALASVSFRTPAGKTYTYEAGNSADFGTNHVAVDINSILEAERRKKELEAGIVNSGANRSHQTYVGLTSDVDEKIPLTTKVSPNTFALIIANEDYAKAIPVAAAYHDGDIFRQYCLRTLGIPEERVLFYPNATLNGVYEALEILKNRISASGTTPEIIFYYAGHGIPDEGTKSAYMMPVDANPIVSKTWIPMKEVYADLCHIPNEGVMAFVDACFSGAARSDNKDDMLNEARGIALKSKDVLPADSSNLFILSAASGNQTALPYKEKNHGLFTYFLLKKLQDSKGGASLQDISDYVGKEVATTALRLFNKPQTPEVMTNGNMAVTWKTRKLK